MQIIFLPNAEKDLLFWHKSGNKMILTKITNLIEAIIVEPYKGIGKPEALKYEFIGLWSRRIDTKHRLVYEISGDILYIHSAKGHYL